MIYALRLCKYYIRNSFFSNKIEKEKETMPKKKYRATVNALANKITEIHNALK